MTFIIRINLLRTIHILQFNIVYPPKPHKNITSGEFQRAIHSIPKLKSLAKIRDARPHNYKRVRRDKIDVKIILYSLGHWEWTKV